MLIKAQKSDVTLKEPLDYHKVFFGHFEPHRVNVQSIHLLLELSRDPIEVRQILRLATLASRRNAAILRKTQVEFLNAIRKTSPKFPTSGPAHVVCLSKLMSLQHYLKRHNVPLSNEALMQLLKYSALYGNSTAVRFILNKLNHQNRKFTKTELRTVLRHFPHTGGADQVVSQHRIIGSPDAWVKNEQLSMITGPLRQRVDSEAGLVEYIAALARFEAPAEIWMEWKILEANGFQYRKTTGAIQDSTIFAFVASLIRAGDIRLAKEMIQGIGTSYPGTVSPATIAELLGYLSSRQRGSVDWRWDGSLSYAVGLVVRSRIQWSAVIKRLDKRGITEGWSEGQVNTLKRVVNEVERYLQTIDTGDDIVKAEGQVLKLLDDM